MQTPVGVVIGSRDRPDVLQRCLAGVSQLQYDPFEVIVVADPAGVAAAQALPFAADLKLLPFDEANISVAPNLGNTHAAGAVVAFIDDDSVPEPQWLRHPVRPAVQLDVDALGRLVRGRYGLFFPCRSHKLGQHVKAPENPVHA